MKDRGSNFGSWATLIGAVVTGAVIALIVGILVGNATEKTKTVTLGQSEVLTPQSQADRTLSPKAPAFTKETLNALPTTNWITNGGSLMNQRYSPLTQINTSNVSQLKGVWVKKLDSVATSAKYSQEGQPIVYNGVMYVPTGADEIYAMDVTTGDIRWKYDAQLDPNISTACCGWDNRGVAIGDGLVYVAQLDGHVVALDMATGRKVWDVQPVRWQDGFTFTHAPLYYENKIYVGTSGGEFGIRGRLYALDAKTGKELWRFYTVPDPNSSDPGQGPADTWPKDKDSWKTGGAPIWQTPAVDPELNMLYFSTGNAAPDVNGEQREGDNLFAASIVAIDATTGKYKWHFQQVHHDIWDYDAPSPTMLYDAVVDGKVVHGIAEASKTGWLYMLDRKTGKPIFPIEEKPVPQDANQKTAATQPYPSNPPFARHELTDDDYKKISEAGKAQGIKGTIKRGKIFDAFGKDPVAVLPGPSGGTNWPPASYNQQLQMFYVCSQNSPAALAQSELPGHKPGQVYIGSLLVSTGFNGEGNVTAIDAQTGEIVWQITTPDSCYSGTVTTAGNLVFVGRNTGELQAYDARNGTRLWSFQTGAGANSTITSFQQDGKQYIAFLAGGNSLAGTPRENQNVWLFALDGTVGPAKAPGAEQGAITHAGEQDESEQSEQTDENTVDKTTPDDQGADQTGGGTAEVKGDADAGKQVFSDNCTTCHGADGLGGNGGPNLKTVADAGDLKAVTRQVTDGGGGMPAFKGQLDDQQIADVSAYVVEQIQGG